MRAASVAVFNDDNEILFGLRKGSWKWCLPGGKLEEGETPLQGAVRELREETGILVNQKDLEPLGEKTYTKDGVTVTVYSFRTYTTRKTPTTKYDPDGEFVCLRHVDVSDGVPEPYASKLHHRPDVTLSFLKLDPEELEKADKPPLLVQTNTRSDRLPKIEQVGLIAPSMAITRADNPLRAFGNVTLLAHPETVDPKKGTPVFDADVYSPRMPQVGRGIDTKKLGALVQQLVPSFRATHDGYDYDYRSPQAIIQAAAMNRKNGVGGMESYEFAPFAHAFLTEKGIQIHGGEDVKLGSIRPDERVNWVLGRTIDRHNLREDFDKWVGEKLDSVLTGDVFERWRPTGGRRVIPATPENLLREMTRNIRGGEVKPVGRTIANAGLPTGAVRAFGAKKFRSLDQVRQASDKLLSDDDMDSAKSNIENELENLQYSIGDRENSLPNAIAESYLPGKSLYQSLFAYGFRNLTPEQYRSVADFAKRLRNAPTGYFEAKPQRIVPLNEFRAAAVPEDLHPMTRDILTRAGLKVDTYHPYDHDGRGNVIRRLAEDNDLLLSEDDWYEYEALVKGEVGAPLTPDEQKVVDELKRSYHPEDAFHKYRNSVDAPRIAKAFLDDPESSPRHIVWAIDMMMKFNTPTDYFIDHPNPRVTSNFLTTWLYNRLSENQVERALKRVPERDIPVFDIARKFPTAVARHILSAHPNEIGPKYVSSIDQLASSKEVRDSGFFDSVVADEKMPDAIRNRILHTLTDTYTPVPLREDTYAKLIDPSATNDLVRENVFRTRHHAYMKPSLYEQTLFDPNENIVRLAVRSGSFNPENIERLHESGAFPPSTIEALADYGHVTPKMAFHSIARGDVRSAKRILQSSGLDEQTHQQIMQQYPDVGLKLADTLMGDKTSSEYLQGLYQSHPDVPEVAFAAARDNKASGPVLHDIAERYMGKDAGSPGLFERLVQHPNTEVQTLRMIKDHPTTLGRNRERAMQRIVGLDPDSAFQERVAVRHRFGTKKFGTNALRKLRDTIASEFGGSAPKKELEKRGLHPGPSIAPLQDAKGNITSQRIQEFIDALPADEWNVSHSEWDGVQRHTTDISKVLQINLTNEKLQRLKDAGVYEVFRKLKDASHSHAHPVNHATIGWIRYTDESPAQDGSGDDPVDLESEWEFDRDSFLESLQEAHNNHRDDWVSERMDDWDQENERDGPDDDDFDARRDAAAEAFGTEYDGYLDDVHNEDIDNDYDADRAIRRYRNATGGNHDWLPSGSDYNREIEGEYSHHGHPGIHIDEVQSDFGSELGEQTRRGGISKEDSAKISDILFGGKHPNETLHEAFHQYLRQTGRTGMRVAIHTPEVKAPLAQQDPDEPLPVHMNITYRDLPLKMGFKEGKYGTLATQGNSNLHGEPSYEDEVRKSEELTKMAVNPAHIQRLDLDRDAPQANALTQGQQFSHPEAKEYEENIIAPTTQFNPIGARDLFGGAMQKLVYQDQNNRRYMVKPYRPIWWNGQLKNEGWNELTSQAMYHAGGIGHLHQTVFPYEHPNDEHGGVDHHLVIAMDPDITQPAYDFEDLRFLPSNHSHRILSDASKIGFMDYLSNNTDRHDQNLLVGLRGEAPHILAIDNGFMFGDKPYHQSVDNRLFGSGTQLIHQVFHPNDYDDYSHPHWHETANWWLQNRHKILQAFDQNVQHLTPQSMGDMNRHKAVQQNVHDRASILDQFAKDILGNSLARSTGIYAVPMPQTGR